MFGLPEALMSFIRRQVGLRTDAASATGSLHARFAALPSTINNIGCFASDNLKLSANVERNMSTTTPTKAKELQVNYVGTVRMSFGLRTGNAATTAYGQIYINGLAYGTVQSTNSISYVTYTQDIAVRRGDSVQIYLWANNTSWSVRVANARMYYDIVDNLDSMVVLD